MRKLLVLFVSLLTSAHAAACSCNVAPPPLTLAREMTAVFVGKVIRAAPRSSGKLLIFEFAVVESLKGKLTGTVTVATPSNSAACGCSFVRGETYLVYANGALTDLQTNLCMRNQQLLRVQTDEEITLLRDAKLN